MCESSNKTKKREKKVYFDQTIAVDENRTRILQYFNLSHSTKFLLYMTDM